MPTARAPVEAAPVETDADLARVIEVCRAEGAFAFDTEFVMEDRYETEVCLVQVASRECVWLIDPYASLDLTPVWNLVADETVQTVVHAGQEDLALCVQHVGRAPRNIFDTQVAAGLIGLDYPLSLQRLVQSVLRIRLHKAKTLTNWRKRPLTADQKRYAADDVQHLLPVREKIEARLRKLKRLDWAQQEFTRLEELGLYRRAEADKLRRVKGAGALPPRNMVILRELLQWRENAAKRVNRPARFVLKDHLLVEIARHELTGTKDIRELRGINLSDRNLRELIAAVKHAQEVPESDWPAPPAREVERPQQAALTALATAVIRDYCTTHELAYALTATQRSIHQLVRCCMDGDKSIAEDCDLIRGWRGKSVGKVARDVITGRSSVVVETQDTQWRLRLETAPPRTDPS